MQFHENIIGFIRLYEFFAWTLLNFLAHYDGGLSITNDSYQTLFLKIYFILLLLFSEIGDKLIEVVGLENCLHMGQVRTGLRSSGKRLAQCSHVIVKVKKRFPMQVDGEPWEQPPGMVRQPLI